MVIFNYGKYKNIDIDDIPTHYILWCIENMNTLSPNKIFCLKIEVLKRYELMEIYNSYQLNYAYKKMCLKYHPDKGGTHGQILVVMDFYKLLKLTK